MAQTYTPTSNTVPTYGEQSASTLQLQKDLNQKYQGTAGYTPLTLDGKYGPLTKAASEFKPAPIDSSKTGSDTGLARVTPTDKTAPVASPKPFDPQAGEDAAYKSLLEKSSGLIDSVNKTSDRELQQRRAGTAGVLAGAGLGGSTAAYSAAAEGEKPIMQERQAALEKVYGDIRTTAHEYSQENYTKASDAVKALAANHLDWNEYKKTNPESYQSLVTSLGGDPNLADAMFAASIPPANIVQSWVNGTRQFQLTQDPITGKPSIQSYDLGMKIPQNWTSEKIGTNATIYHGPNWDPTDPKTYQIFAIDPLTGLPSGQIAGDPNPDAPFNPDTVTGAVSNVSKAIGATDPKIPLSDAISQYGIENIVAGIIQNEGSSPAGVSNNPGNIKYKGLPGQTDSGVKAADGGTFASYATPADGAKAIASIVQNAANGGSSAYGESPSLASFVNTYTGQGGSTIGGQPVNENNSILQAAGLDLPVFNYLTQGTASMSRMSAAQRNQIMNKATQWLNDKGIDVSTFQSQYKTYNDVLSKNISRFNNTKIAENELISTADLLGNVIDQTDLKNLKIANVAKLFKGEQVNDPLITKYAFHLQQMRNELALFFAASQGKASPDVIDNSDAEAAITNGLSSRSVKGFQDAVKSAADKMNTVLQGSVDHANKSIWDLFGVADKYNSKQSEGGSVAKGSMSDRDFVEKALSSKGYKYDDVVKNVPAGQIPVLDNTTGEVGFIPSGEFNSSKYTRV